MKSGECEPDLAPVTERLHSVWRESVEASPAVEQVRKSLRLHRHKMGEISEELSNAERWEKVLRAKHSGIEEQLKPALLKFAEKVERNETVEEEDIEINLVAGKWRNVLTVLSHNVERVTGMERGQLTRLVMTVMKVRDVLTDRHPELEEAVVTVQDLGARVLQQLGGDRIVWSGLSDWEAEIVRQVVPQLEGVPRFVVRIIDQMMLELERKQQGEGIAGDI